MNAPTRIAFFLGFLLLLAAAMIPITIPAPPAPPSSVCGPVTVGAAQAQSGLGCGPCQTRRACADQFCFPTTEGSRVCVQCFAPDGAFCLSGCFPA